MDGIKYLEKIYKTVPNAYYYDSTGLLPRENVYLWFLGPNDPSSKEYTLYGLTKKKPDFIFFTAKLKLANPELGKIIKEDYQKIKTDIWLRKDHVGKYDFSTLAGDHSLERLFIFDYLPYLRF